MTLNCQRVSADSVSSRGQDYGSALDEHGVYSQWLAVWTHALPLHRALLPRDDRAGVALGTIGSDTYVWIALGCVIIVGSKLIWWATERAWGKFS